MPKNSLVLACPEESKNCARVPLASALRTVKVLTKLVQTKPNKTTLPS
jgi:hypothetical protein